METLLIPINENNNIEVNIRLLANEKYAVSDHAELPTLKDAIGKACAYYTVSNTKNCFFCLQM